MLQLLTCMRNRKGQLRDRRGKAFCHLSLGKQVERGDQKVESAINA